MNPFLPHRSMVNLTFGQIWRAGLGWRVPGWSERQIFTRTGRLALWVALKALALPEKARIGVQPFLPYEVFEMILRAGYRPCFLDMDPKTLNISLDDLAQHSATLDALLLVYTLGNPQPVRQIRQLVGNRLPVIVDLAHCLPSPHIRAAVEGAQFSFYSFRFGKLMSALEGGLLEVHQSSYLPAAQHFAAHLSQQNGFLHSARRIADAIRLSVRLLAVRPPLYGLLAAPLYRRVGQRVDLAGENALEFGPPRELDRRLAALQFFQAGHGNPALQKLFRRHRFVYQVLHNWAIPELNLPRYLGQGEDHFFKLPIIFSSPELKQQFQQRLLENGVDSSSLWSNCIQDAYQRYGYRGGCIRAEWLVPRILCVSLHQDGMVVRFLQTVRAMFPRQRGRKTQKTTGLTRAAQ